jgi:hypothetical protein
MRQEVLDRQRTLERLVEGTIDDSHAPGAEALLKPVAFDLLGETEALTRLAWLHERNLSVCRT